MYRNAALLALAGSSSVLARPNPLKRDIANKKVVCFDFGDCLIFGAGIASCDRNGENASLLGILGTCVPAKGGLSGLLGLGKRHGPDEDDDAAVVVVAVNATATPAAATSTMPGMNMKRHGPDGDDDEEVAVVVAVNATAAAPAKRQIIADIVGGTAGAAADVVGGVVSLGADAVGSGIDAGKDVAESIFDAGKDTLSSLLSIPGDILGFGGYGYDDKVKRQIIADIIGGTAGAAADVVGGVAGLGADAIGSGIDAGKDVAESIFDAGKDTLGSLLSIPGDILGFGGYGYDDKVKRQIIADLIGSAADVSSDVIGGTVDAAKDTADALLGGLGDVLSLPGDILGGFGGYGYGYDD